MKKEIDQKDRIPILRAAINGNDEAQQRLLDYFDGFINAMATTTVFLPTGQMHTYLDEDIKVQLQCKLLTSLKRFDLDGLLAKDSECCEPHPLGR